MELIKNNNEKIAILAGILSIIPGIGQAYVGDTRKGIGIFLIGTMFVIVEIFLVSNITEPAPVIVAGIAIILFWISNIYDAYTMGKNKN